MCMKQHYTWTWLQAGGHRDKQSYRNFSYLHISHSAVQLLCCMPLNCCYISLWCSLHTKIRFFFIVYVKAIFPSAVNDSWRKNETNKGVRTTESVETVLRQCHFFLVLPSMFHESWNVNSLEDKLVVKIGRLCFLVSIYLKCLVVLEVQQMGIAEPTSNEGR